MKKRIVIGYSDYQQLLIANGYFVDKTLLIKEVIDTGNQVILLPRLRRFGKSINLSMLRYFLDLSLSNTSALFKPLNFPFCLHSDYNSSTFFNKYTFR